MNFDLKALFERTLHGMANRHIFLRGEKYYISGAVKKWQLGSFGRTCLSVNGSVKGSHQYETSFKLDFSTGKCSETYCSCPYEFGCKHLVALGFHLDDLLETYFDFNNPETEIDKAPEKLLADILVFARTEYDDAVTPLVYEEKQENDVGKERKQLETELAQLGIPTELLEDELVKKLLDLKFGRVTQKPLPMNIISAAPTIPSFDPVKYYIRLDGDLNPSLSLRSSPYMTASVKEVLAKPNITEAQKELLEGVRTGAFNPRKNPDRDLAHLATLIQKSGFKASMASSYIFTPISFVTEPSEKLKASIKYTPLKLYDEDKVEREIFIFEMPSSPTLPQLVAGNKHLAFITEKIIKLYPMPPILGNIIARVREYWQPEMYGQRYYSSRKPRYATELTGEEISKLDEIMLAAKEYLDLTEPLPDIKKIERGTIGTPVFVADYDAKAESIHVSAVVDYGTLRQDVSESIHWSMSGGTKHLALRRNWQNEKETHRITVSNGTISITPINEKAEINFFAELAKEYSALKFSAMLKCDLNGQKKIVEYLKNEWKTLVKFAEKRGYPICATRDKIGLEEATFRADFSVDINADRDWLYFDIACYCGEERLTLADIIAFIESGETVFRRADQTLVEVSNREELLRLVAMLKNFHARENGFEGKLHHAAELQYVLTSSPHYNTLQAESLKRFMKQVESGKPVKAVTIPTHLNKILREYQKDGLHWLHFLRSYRFGGILADDMGLGKTIQALAVISMNRIEGEPSIVVCPKSLLYNWKSEAATYAPKLKTLVYEGTPEERAALAPLFSAHDLIITNYNSLKRDGELFSDPARRFNYAVLDEAQFIKNHASKNAQVAKRLNAGYRIALTGTPLENSVSELWSIFDFLMPGFLGNYKHFSDHFHKPIMDKGDTRALKHLREKIAPFMLRRAKSEVLSELPAKIEQNMICELGTEQNLLYQQILAKVRGEIFATVEKKGFKSSQIHILAGLTKLRQVCNHPALLLPKDKRGRKHKKEISAKLNLALELVGQAIEGGHKMLIFSQFTSMLDIIAEELKERNITYLYLSGVTNNRAELVQKFNTDPSIPIFLISMKAGGTGLNLTGADTVIIFDPWWNPSVEAQAADRAHRIGQTKTVNVYRLLTKGTIEEKIQELKARKRSLSDALVDNSGDLIRKLTWDDVRKLFS